MRLVSASLFILLLVCCGPSGSPEVTEEVDTTAADTESIEQAAEQWVEAFKAADASALSALYATDAVVMPPNEESHQGRAATQAWNEQFFGQFTVEEAELSTDKLAVNGDWAYRVGSYEMNMKPAEGESIGDAGKFIEIWARQADGSWKIAYDIWNSNNPLPESTE